MNLWYLFLLIPTALLLFVFVFINIWNELIIKDKNEVKEKKMNKKEIIEKLLEKVDELSDKLETLTDKYKQTFKDLEYLKFKQDVKGNMLVTFSNFNIPNGMSLNNFMIYTEYKDETGKEEVVVGTPVYPVLKYLKNNQVIALECKDVITTSIFDKIVVTSFPDNQYIIKLIPEKKYYKSEPIYMFADLRHYKFNKLTLEKCQELGISLDIDKGRKWVEI